MMILKKVLTVSKKVLTMTSRSPHGVEKSPHGVEFISKRTLRERLYKRFFLSLTFNVVYLTN